MNQIYDSNVAITQTLKPAKLILYFAVCKISHNPMRKVVEKLKLFID